MRSSKPQAKVIYVLSVTLVALIYSFVIFAMLISHASQTKHEVGQEKRLFGLKTGLIEGAIVLSVLVVDGAASYAAPYCSATLSTVISRQLPALGWGLSTVCAVGAIVVLLANYAALVLLDYGYTVGWESAKLLLSTIEKN